MYCCTLSDEGTVTLAVECLARDDSLSPLAPLSPSLSLSLKVYTVALVSTELPSCALVRETLEWLEQNAALVGIDAVGQPTLTRTRTRTQGAVSIPLHVATTSAALLPSMFATPSTLFPSITLSLDFRNNDSSSPARPLPLEGLVANQLLAQYPTPLHFTLARLVHSALANVFDALSRAFPLCFDPTWVQRLVNDLGPFRSVATSLSRILNPATLASTGQLSLDELNLARQLPHQLLSTFSRPRAKLSARDGTASVESKTTLNMATTTNVGIGSTREEDDERETEQARRDDDDDDEEEEQQRVLGDAIKTAMFVIANEASHRLGGGVSGRVDSPTRFAPPHGPNPTGVIVTSSQVAAATNTGEGQGQVQVQRRMRQGGGRGRGGDSGTVARAQGKGSASRSARPITVRPLVPPSRSGGEVRKSGRKRRRRGEDGEFHEADDADDRVEGHRSMVERDMERRERDELELAGFSQEMLEF